MSYTALYYKWCPISFESIKGQDPIVQTLRNQITLERIGHAYLFCGTKGASKTSIAKIFAGAVNCERPVNGSPYNEHSACRSIQSGSSMDMMEMNVASNSGVENICDIREQVQYPSIEECYRVYIIGEVHMLSIGTFSVLLKTLEEPPSYVILILTAAEVHKIPVTTLSHCQRYDFKRISSETVASRLRELTQTEQIQVEDKVLLHMARAVNGPLRNALSLLDQCVAFHYGKVLTYDDALEVLGAVDSDVLSQMFGAIMEGRTKNCICNLEEIVIQGRELGQFVTNFIWYMRNLFLIQSTDGTEGPVDMSKENLKQSRSDTDKTGRTMLVRHIRIFSELSNQLRYASQKWVLVEVTLIKLARLSMEPNLDTTLQRLGGLEAQVEDLEAGRMAIPMAVAYQEAGGVPAEQAPRIGAGPGADGGVVPQAAAPYVPGLQTNPGAAPEKVALPQAQLRDLKLVRNEWAKIVRSMGGGARSYLRDIVVEPGGEGCLTIVSMDLVNYDMGKRPTVIGELERYVEANFNRSIYFKTRLAGRGERLNTIYVTQGGLEEKIHMDTTYKDK